MVFTDEIRKNLYGVSLDRIDNTKGYTPENARLICHGINQLKATKSDAELKAFVKNKGEQRAIEEAEITTRVRRKLGDMEKGELTVGDYIELLRETRGVCGITGVQLDMTFARDGTENLYNPSPDRKDSAKGYEKGNV